MQLTWKYLTTPVERPEIIWPYFAIFIVSIIASLVLYIAVEKKKIPKFQKRFIRKIADFLLYMPILFLIIVSSVYAKINSIGLPIYVVILGVIWLIWLIFLIYYRLVIVSEFWKLYFKQKKDEKYIHGKGKNNS